MGNYINPGNNGFSEIRNDVYVDKTALISQINQIINTPRRLICISRPENEGRREPFHQAPAFREILCRPDVVRLLWQNL